MRLHPKLWISISTLAVFLLSGCGLSLAGDVTPPPNYVAPTELPTNPASAQPANQPAVFPLVPPDPAQGEAIFVAKCLPCHGAKGMGDGPQAANLPNPAAPIGSADLARKAKPVDWYNMVTNGNLQNYMPGFTDTLSDRQRWDVVAYALSLSTSADDLAKGKKAYQANCAACHGETGKGDGPQAASLSTKPAAWASDQSSLAQLSADDIVNVLTGGKDSHPTFADKLVQTQRYQVAAFVRSLSFASGQPAELAAAGSTETPGAQQSAQPATTPPSTGEATSQSTQKVTITGQVTNGTPGGKVPDNLKVNLLAYNGMNPAFDLSSFTNPDGSYRFDNVQLDANYVYYAQVDTNGLVFNSDILHGTDVKGAEAKLPVQIYETATDPSPLKIDRMHVFFDFSKPGLVQIVNLLVISNTSDKVIIAEPRTKPVIQVDLPQGAQNLQFQDGALGDGRYVQTDNGFGDTQAVIPGTGQYQVLFAYDMPYTNKLDVTFKAPLPVDAAIVMVPPVGVKLKSTQLSDTGQQNVQGMSFHAYQSVSSLKAGDALAVSLSGKAGTAGSSQDLVPLLIGIGVFGLALVGAGLWLYRRRSMQALQTAEAGLGEEPAEVSAEPGESSDAILDAILALDDLHANGKLPDAAYQERRAELKARLATIMEKEKGR